MYFSSLSPSPASQPLIAMRVVFAFFISLLCHRALAQEAEAVRPEHVRSGSLLLGNIRGRYHPAISLSTHANVAINGITAQVHLTQRFENQSNDWSEAIYVFPLPEDAAVYAMQMRIGERVIIGKIREKAEAQELYTQAKRAGKMAALTEQERPNLFTQTIANIPPGATVEVDLHYQHRVLYDMGAFSWRLPTTLTPRYIPGEALTQDVLSQEALTGRFSPTEDNITQSPNAFGWAQPTHQVKDAHRITPQQQPHGAKHST